jgi:hypothetical protein
MPATTGSVNIIRIYLPFAVNGQGIVLEPGLTNFINTARPLTADNMIYEFEAHDHSFDVSWTAMEFAASPSNQNLIQSAAQTLQTALNAQNGNPTPEILVKAFGVPVTGIQFS